MDISRDTYVGSEDDRTRHGLTFDLFTALYDKMDALPCAKNMKEFNKLRDRVSIIEQRTIWHYLSNIKGKISLRQAIFLFLLLSALITGGVEHKTLLEWISILG